MQMHATNQMRPDWLEQLEQQTEEQSKGHKKARVLCLFLFFEKRTTTQVHRSLK